ncbi:uncharacterized protein MYCGRDRAFT_98096 [Zymoseptoria tritici IPO323]|uniref:Uncharacterized protein n=1 Tax=Zymoseptoria tritici (strain CBS 115943 / IPO323) TaxID=336722 RepID=F9XSA5_ZYMTI|nr:uncharacterized protein MYCGRDRAFT_98096 [Zymoseptoria tritici IPO323]EGP81870.1 hypothetical protein MYCGRDRAFT_98096 [Zymoseptoria tritici IPO323]
MAMMVLMSDSSDVTPSRLSPPPSDVLFPPQTEEKGNRKAHAFKLWRSRVSPWNVRGPGVGNEGIGEGLPLSVPDDGGGMASSSAVASSVKWAMADWFDVVKCVQDKERWVIVQVDPLCYAVRALMQTVGVEVVSEVDGEAAGLGTGEEGRGGEKRQTRELKASENHRGTIVGSTTSYL